MVSVRGATRLTHAHNLVHLTAGLASLLPADQLSMNPIAPAIKSRDTAALRDVVTRVLEDVGEIRVGLPAALTRADITSKSQLAAVVKDLVSAARAKVGGPRVKGQFCVCIVTPGGGRASGIYGALIQGGSSAKFFGRHKRTVEEQTTFLDNNEVDVLVGTPTRLAKLDPLQLEHLRYILVDCTADDKGMTVFTAPSKKMVARRPDTEDLAAMLSSPAFQAAAQREKRAPMLCPVLLPPSDTFDSAAPEGADGQRAHRGGRSGGKGARGGKGSRGRGVGRGRGPIGKKPRGK